MTEHTDRQALEDLYNWPTLPAPPPTPRLWYRRTAAGLWRFLKVDLWKAPLEMDAEDSAIMRRIRVSEWATRGARRLRHLDREDQQEVLRVTARLLGLGRRVR